MRGAFAAHLDSVLASERPTLCRFIGTVHISCPGDGKMTIFDKMESLMSRRIGQDLDSLMRGRREWREARREEIVGGR